MFARTRPGTRSSDLLALLPTRFDSERYCCLADSRFVAKRCRKRDFPAHPARAGTNGGHGIATPNKFKSGRKRIPPCRIVLEGEAGGDKTDRSTSRGRRAGRVAFVACSR